MKYLNFVSCALPDISNNIQTHRTPKLIHVIKVFYVVGNVQGFT